MVLVRYLGRGGAGARARRAWLQTGRCEMRWVRSLGPWFHHTSAQFLNKQLPPTRVHNSNQEHPCSVTDLSSTLATHKKQLG